MEDAILETFKDLAYAVSEEKPLLKFLLQTAGWTLIITQS